MSDGFDPSASSSGSDGGAEESDPLIGELLDGRYKIIDMIGEGGMGQVYRAEHIKIGKFFAIKVLRSEIVTNEEAVARFEREARSASSIGHKNIIEITDSNRLADGRVYLAMELLEGEPFNDMIEKEISVERLLQILIQTSDGLAAAHAKGIVHRDMKPENIFITTVDGKDVPKLLDFGIAKVAGTDGQNNLTQTGTIFGTPFYMAPEQALGQGVDHRADIYAMGVIMYEVFCGSIPFAGDSFMHILTQHITAEPKPPSQMAAEYGRTLPPGIEDLIIKAMKKEPDERHQSMEEFKAELVQVYQNVVGAGMSSYMPAQAASHASAPTPYPTGPHQQGHGPIAHQATPTPMGRPDPSQPYLPAASSAHFPPHAGASDSFVPRKSKKGAIVAVFVVLAIVGGVIAVVVTQGDGAETAANSDTPPDPTADPKDPPTTTDPVDPPAKDDQTNGLGSTGEIDAGTIVEPTDTPPVEVVVKVRIFIKSKPKGATIYLEGKKIGITPKLVTLIKGKKHDLRLEKRNHKPLIASVDGTEEEVEFELKRKRRTGGGHGTHKDPGDGKPPPPKDPCKANPSLPQCQLE